MNGTSKKLRLHEDILFIECYNGSSAICLPQKTVFRKPD